MSDDKDMIVQGREVQAADLRVESTHESTLPQGFVWLGFACWLAGPLRALANLPSDLSAATSSTFAPAVPLMALGFALVATGGLLAVASSETVQRGLEDIRSRFKEDPEPLADGGGKDE